jgi:hypothetical protein
MHTTYSVIRVGGILVQFDFFVLGNPLHAITSDIVWYYIYLDYAKYYNACTSLTLYCVYLPNLSKGYI